MDEYEMRKKVYEYIKEISHFSQTQVFATSDYQKNYFQRLIDGVVEELIDFCFIDNRLIQQQNNMQTLYIQQLPSQQPGPLEPSQQNQQGRVITQEELAQNNGSEGKPAYVAVNGIVYDVSSVIAWAGGTHFGLYSGNSLSNEFMACHMGMVEILKKLPVVGMLK